MHSAVWKDAPIRRPAAVGLRRNRKRLSVKCPALSANYAGSADGFLGEDGRVVPPCGRERIPMTRLPGSYVIDIGAAAAIFLLASL